MQINLPPPSPAELACLEAEAAAHPTRYRVVLRTLALVGDVVLMFVRVLPLAFVPIAGAVIINNSFFYGLAGIAVPFLVWLVRPGRRDDGNPISPKEMPELYAAVDRNASFYLAPVEKDSRSYMNPVFRLPTEDLEKKFVSEAKKAGMVGLKGHRSAGGIRASIYNAVSPADVQKLVEFMDAFAKANG